MSSLQTRKWPILAAAILAATSILTAQQQQQQTQPRPTPKPQTQAPKFKAATDIVSTDVRISDASGRFIPDLTMKDFEVYEDGVKQKISNFVAMVGGRAMSEVTPVEQPVTEGIVMPRTSKPAEVLGRIFIIFIDDLHLQPLDSIRAKRVLQDIRDNVLHEEDLIGIVSSGYSSVSFDVNPDPRHLRMNQAIEKTMGSGMTPQEIINTAQTIEGPSGLRHNAYVAFKVAYEILEQAEKINNRRKAFIYVSSGYDFNPFTNSRYQALQDMYAAPPPVVDQGRPTSGADPLSSLGDSVTPVFRNPFEMNGLQFSDSDLNAALGELVRRARRANVAFYPVDPRGLVAGPDANMPISQEEWAKFMNTSLSSLDVIAGETGGKCICRTNDFKRGLQNLDNEMSDYYVIGYESNNPDPLKIRRRIEIKVLRPGAQKPIYKDWYSIKR